MAAFLVYALLLVAALLWFQPWTTKPKPKPKMWWEYPPPPNYYVQAFQSWQKTMQDAEKEYRRHYGDRGNGNKMPEPLERHFREQK